MYRNTAYEMANYWSILDKPFLKLKQKLLLKKYLTVVKKYNIEYKKRSDEQQRNMILDELIIQRKAYYVHEIVRNSFDDIYINSIDKNKFEETKKFVNEEIDRMNILIEKIKNNRDYVSDYSLEDLGELFTDEGLIQSYFELSMRLKESNQQASKIVELGINKVSENSTTEEEITNEEDNSTKKIKNIVLFPKK